MSPYLDWPRRTLTEVIRQRSTDKLVTDRDALRELGAARCKREQEELAAINGELQSRGIRP